MKLITLTLLDGNKAIFNAEQIAFFHKSKTGTGTLIYFGGLEDDYWPVKETVQEVENLIFTDWIRLPK